MRQMRGVSYLKKAAFLIFTMAFFTATPAVFTSCSGSEKVKTSEEKAVKYHCPMHPTYISDKPGECPICGMTLVPIKEEEKGKYPPGTVSISPYKEQIIGVKYSKVEYVPLVKKIRTVGIVKPDEEMTYHVNIKVKGWIEKLYVDYTGAFVKRGEPLFLLYSPELVSTQQEYLIALRAYLKVMNSGDPQAVESAKSLLESVRQRLLLWDINPQQIKELEERGVPFEKIPIYSKYTGYVIKKNVLEGTFVSPGTLIYEIADLSVVWVMVDIYEMDLPFVEEGMEVKVNSPYIPGLTLRGEVDYVYPYLNPETRTQKIRVKVENKGLTLRPDMYVNAEVEVPVGKRLAVPVDAVMRTGERDIVFVKVKEGKLAPREVSLGPEVNDYFVVLDGLKEGEEIVTSANFLIDSESKLKLALEAMGGRESEGHHH